MTQEDKELLLKEDLCARFPYGVKLEVKYQKGAWKLFAIYYEWDKLYVIGDGGYPIESKFADCKPYLFPISSMTEEEKEEYCRLQQRIIYNSKGVVNEDATKYIRWCYKKHLDINNLIPIGLAIDATNLSIY